MAKSFVAKLNADPRLSGVTSGFNPNFPQYLLRVDLAKAAKLGIDVNESMETLQSYVGSFYSSNFVRFGQMYKVMLQAAPEYRMNPEDLFGLYAKNKREHGSVFQLHDNGARSMVRVRLPVITCLLRP